MIFIRIRRDDFYAGRLRFLSSITGFNEEDSYPSDLPNNVGYITYTAFYDVHFDSKDKGQIKKSIEKNGGHVTKITPLGTGPMLSKETRDMLLVSFLMGIVAFLSGLTGVHFLSPLSQIQEALSVGVLTAAATFVTELVIELKVRQRQTSKD
jgi:hypothetical protein